MTIVIIGGGVAGLAVAHALRRQGVPESDLYVAESSDTPGGHVRTVREHGYVVETGPNGFLDSEPATLRLVDDLGLTAQLRRAAPAAANRYIYRKGKLRRIAAHPLRFLASGVLPLHGALRIAAEPWMPRGTDPEESVFDFAARRIGTQAASLLVDAMVSGVFAGDARRLELASAFPKMAAMERTCGSLFAAMRHRAKERKRQAGPVGGPTGPAGTLTSFADGFAALPTALAAALGSCVHTGCAVVGLRPRGDRFEVRLANGDVVDARQVVLAAPAWKAASLVADFAPDMAADLAAIPYPPVHVVATAFDGVEIPQGFGFLVPRGQGLRILGCLWTSAIWPDRAPGGKVLLRTMVGGAHDPQVDDLSDQQLVDVVLGDLHKAMGPLPDPEHTWVFRHSRAIAQYTPGHQRRLARLDDACARWPGLHLCGSSYRGISVNHCIAQAPRIAEAVTAHA